MAALSKSGRPPDAGHTGDRGFRKLLVGLATSALTLAGLVPAHAAATPTVLHVFLAVGQSNMSGRGLPSGTTDDPADSRIFQFGATNRTFRTASVPLDMHDTAGGISPATTFARGYLKTQPANVGVLIIPAAHGDTGFTDAAATLTWTVGAATSSTFDLPALAVAQTFAGMAAARARGRTVSLKGILWHQGEKNSTTSTSEYSARLDRLIAFFRSRLAAPKLPFVVGRMSLEGIEAAPGRANVDKSHRETPERVAHTGFAPSLAGAVNAGDPIHFSRSGVDYLGRTYLSGFLDAVRNTLAPSAVPIPPTRFLDTRLTSQRVGGGRSVSFRVAGVRGMPLDVSAVVVNLTVTEPTSFGFITAHASGKARPEASNVNYAAGQTTANLAVVPVGNDGRVTLSNTSSGSVQIIADVSAYFRAGAPSPGAFRPLDPIRFLDTRLSPGRVPGGGSVSFKVGGTSGIPADASAVVMNLTATEPRSSGFLTAHAAGAHKPNASNVNFAPGQTVPNLVVVPVGRDGKVTVSNTSAGSTQVVADVSGYFLPGDPDRAGAFAAVTPTRFLDTRSSSGRVAAGGSVTFQVGGRNGIPANPAAVVVNLTVTETTSYGLLTAYASGASRPNTSNVNYARGQTVPNLAVVPAGADGKVRITNSSRGSAHIVADVSGYILK
ncbi:hypothetical protein QFZ69_004089 [Arthrobacter sp. V1I7]|uniref:sialate O-acetylesterase n=1 Tax=Arthrobacter sp. V1I7 TaxID=3042274 RepID=UPI0027843F75|nr:sialate O-acetylesterase [Arthrobacter sp. V1I7]MDQ0823210.1 hypothetical protein [Arthrobacter sp. V1I7]